MTLAENRRLTFRIGINLGDVIVKDNDLLGDAVNVAARLESQAEPGGLCISGTVYDQIVGKLDLQFEIAGELSLKNIPRPIRAYKFGGSGASTAPTAPAPIAPPPAPPKSRDRFLLALAGAVGLVLVAVSAILIGRDQIPASAPAIPGPQTATRSPASAALRTRFDGVWSGSWCPRAWRSREAFCAARVVRVTGGRIDMESGQPGQPGYTKISGTISESGEVQISGTGVGSQGTGRGLPFSVELRGRVQGEMMTTAGQFENGREIEFNLTRTQR
jgi:hypothetical protein